MIGPHLTMETEGVHDLDGIWLDGVQVYCVECHLHEGWARCYVVKDVENNLYPSGPGNTDLTPVTYKGEWIIERFDGKVTITEPIGGE